MDSKFVKSANMAKNTEFYADYKFVKTALKNFSRKKIISKKLCTLSVVPVPLFCL
jgi:hypothetical protein